MLDACVQTIARNAEDYLYPCLSKVAPYVKRVRLTVDSRSTDNTTRVAERLAREFPNVELGTYHVERPISDLVEMRNSQLGFPEKWGFIVDSDEYHQDVDKYEFGGEDAYAFRCYALWGRDTIHKSSSKAVIGRVFRNGPDVVWRGRWGKESLYRGSEKVFLKVSPVLPFKYIHFTHIKHDPWREELGQERVADGKFLSKTPPEIIRIVDEIHEKALPFLPIYRV